MASLAEIRARLAAQENKGQSKGAQAQSDNSVYAHWNMDEGTTATVRFLPDGDASNSYFWVEKLMIKLPFNGIKGEQGSKRIEVAVPCMEMYNESCPILSEVRTWYKDESMKETANKYWKKRSYLFQGFVHASPMTEDKVPENPIRRFVISPQIFTTIKATLMDPEIEEMPTDYVHGLDFNIKKTAKGGYADYSTSNWARKESALSMAEQAAIESYGLYNLRDFLPKKPSEAEQRIIQEMFEASVDGQPYDPDRWGAYFKPYGLQLSTPTRDGATNVASAPVATPAPAVKTPVADEVPPWEDTSAVAEVKAAPAPAPAPASNAASGSDKAQDILAMIRSRQTKTA
jgi:hypothetical protein